MAKKKKKNATLTGALGSYLEEKFGNKEEKKTISKVTTDENGNVTINNSPKKEREGILVTGVKKTISDKSSLPSKILGLATNGIGEVIYNTVEAGINESKNKKVEQTVDTIKKDSDTAYNKLKDYKKENSINLFNENSKRVQNDEKYQGLLKEAQEKTTTLEKERTNRNSEIIKDAVKEKSGTLSGGIIKTGTTLAGGFETGIGGIESTTKKILGQTPSLDDQEIKYNMFSDVAQNNINTTKNPVGRAGLEMTYSIGQMLPQMMTGNSAGAFATGFANYGGSAYNQAKKDGATEEQATKYGIVSGTLEMAMEKALGGFESVYGKSVLGNSTNKLTSKVLDKYVKNKALRKTLTSMKGEFTEEYLQEFLGPIVEEALLNKDNGVGIKNSKNAKELASNIASYTAKNFFSTQNLYAGTLGAVTSGVMEGPQNIARNQWAKQTGRDFDTGYTQNEQKVIDEIVNKETTKKSREQAINTEIENAIKEQEQNFSISEENKNKIAERIKKEYENKDIDLSNTKLSDKEIKSIRKSVEKSLQEGTIDADEISNILGNDTDISKDDLLHRSFYEKSQKSVNYQYEENKTDSDITKALKESASKVMNNTTKSRNFVENVNKIAQERGTRYEFVNNEQLEKMGYEVKGKDINGLVGKDLQGNEKILINIDSKQALNKIVGHETTHLLEGTEEYTLLQNAVKEYAKSKGDYDHRIKSTEKLYSGLDANIENEVTSDLVGEYIFNDEEFIKKLSTSQPNVFTKIYDYVKHLYKTVTAGSQEARDLEKVKYRFEQAYKENVKDIKLDTNFSLSENALQEVSDVVNQTREDSEKSLTQFVKLKDNTIKSLVDYGVKDLPMLERSGHIRENILTEEQAKKLGFSTKNKHFHGLGVKTYLEIINSMDNPIGVYQYTNNGNYDNNNFIVVTPVEINKTNYIVPVEINQKGQYNQVEIDYNKIKTAYSKNNTDYIQNLLNQGKIKEIFNGSNSRKTSLDKSNIPQSNKNVKSDISNNSISNNNKNDTRYSLSNNELKQKQLDIVLENNPVQDEYHTWIRNVDDIKTFEETLQDSDYKEYYEAGEDFDETYTANMAKEALETGKITIYSSYPIDLGVFVSPSYMEAESYSSNGKVYSKEVNLKDVAWIDPTQGQYTPINNIKYSLSEENIPIADKYTKDEVLNPIEISNLTKEDAVTTPKLPSVKRETGDGNSKFFDNIKDKTNMLSENSKNKILSEEDVKYYKKVTNEEALTKAFDKLQEDRASETMKWFSKKSEQATDIDVAEGWILMKQYEEAKDYDSMIEVAKKMREMGTKAGQTVQAFNIMSRLTPEGMVKYAQSELSEAFETMSKNKTKKWIDENRDRFNLTPEEVQFIIDNMNDIQNISNDYDKKVKLAEIQKVMSDKLPPERGAGIKAWMRISMLFNPKTQVRNVLGNAVITPVNLVGDFVASKVDKKISQSTGVRTTGNTSLSSYASGFKKGLYQSYNDFKKGINTREMEGNRFEIGAGKSFNDNKAIGKALNKVDNLLGFMLDAGDRGFYEATFTNSINNQMILNNTTEVTKEMIDIATNEALQRTWQDNNNYTKFVLSVRNMMNNINVKGYGLGDVLIPFAKTPANLTKAIVDYSPVGLVTSINKGVNLKKALSNGQFTSQMQHDFVQSLGKATAGTLLYILGYALAKLKIVSGDSDDDKDVANFMKNTLGVSSYSIKIGNKSFSYDWAQPIAAPLSIMANIVQNQEENQNLLENVMSSINTAGNIILEQSFMESIQTVLSNNKGIASGIQEAILDLPARAVPTFLKQIVDYTDGTQRQTFEKDKPLESMINSVKAKIPGLSTTLAPSVDTLGRNIQKYGGKNNLFNVFLNPANLNTENISESAQEIYDIYKQTGNVSVMPRVAPYYINKDGEKINLNSKQRAEYQRVSGELIEENVNNLQNLYEYQQMDNQTKSDVIANIVNYSYAIAQNEVLGTEISNTYKKAKEYYEIGGNISDFYIFKNSIDNTDSETKKESITNFLIDSDLSNKEIAKLYSNYYGNESDLNNLVDVGISAKEYIKFKSQSFKSDVDSKGNAISGSRKKKIISYANSLNLTAIQKAILIKSVYSSFTQYDRQISQYINKQNLSFLSKASLVKQLGFTQFDKQIISYVKKNYSTLEEQKKKLKDLGFKVYEFNGKTYVKR